VAFSLEDVRDAVAFQFLIGRLDTLRSLSFAASRLLFQFLIGRLDT